MTSPLRVLALLAIAVTGATGCEDPPPAHCVYEGTPMLSMTPRKGEGTLDGDVTDLPAFPAPQGVPASEIDFELTGIDQEDITTIHVTVVADTLGTISDATYTPESIGFVCRESGGVIVRNLPVAYGQPISIVQDLEMVTGTLTVDITGLSPMNESYPVEMRVTSY